MLRHDAALLSGFAILIAWILLDLPLHRLFLAPLYDASRELWRPFDQMNVTLIYVGSLVLIGVFIAIYRLLGTESRRPCRRPLVRSSYFFSPPPS